MDMGLTLSERSPIARRQPRQRRDVTINEICRRLGVTLMTVNQWRLGSPCRYPLPYYVEPRGVKGHRVRITEEDLVQYLDDFRPDLLDRWNSTPSMLAA